MSWWNTASSQFSFVCCIGPIIYLVLCIFCHVFLCLLVSIAKLSLLSLYSVKVVLIIHGGQVYFPGLNNIAFYSVLELCLGLNHVFRWPNILLLSYFPNLILEDFIMAQSWVTKLRSWNLIGYFCVLIINGYWPDSAQCAFWCSNVLSLNSVCKVSAGHISHLASSGFVIGPHTSMP